MMFDNETPEEVLERMAKTEWYIVTITGINAEGNPDCADVQMGDNIELAVRGWSEDKGWTNTVIANKQYIGQIPNQKH